MNDGARSRWTSRWFLMSVVLCSGAFYLAITLDDPTPFTAVATIALGGGHATNVMERRHGPTNPPHEDLP